MSATQMDSSKSQINPPHFGPALSVTFLLRDYENYGLSERVRYHFHLSEVLGDSAALLNSSDDSKYREDTSGRQKSREAGESSGAPPPRTPSERSGGSSTGALRFLEHAPCGVARVLECIPALHHNRLSRQQRLFLKTSLLQLNQRLETYDSPCCEPSRLPVRLNASTRVSFAYETTRIVLLVDASPSMTATFGVAQMKTSNDGCCCPLDRLPGMASTLFHALAEKIPLPYRQGFWQPKLSVTVLAVYPAITGDEAESRTSLLVRDWTVSDNDSAETLLKHLKEWVFSSVEEEIAARIRRRSSRPEIGLDSFLEENHLSPTTFVDWWTAGKAALAALSSAGRPCIVVATDGRSVSSDRGFDDLDDRDTPFFILDLSSPFRQRRSDDKPLHAMQSMMQEDPGADFPLAMSDDREALYHICRTTGGCFWDKTLLEEASKTRVGQVPSDSPLAVDQYLGKLVRKHQPHMVRPNAVQWYTLFSLSPLSPTFYANWGQLPPPAYLRQRLNASSLPEPMGTRSESQGGLPPQSNTVLSDHRRSSHGQISGQETPFVSKESFDSRSLFPDQRKSQVRVQFSTYFINPVRILGLLMMRVKEGYRAIRYGQSTHDPDKVSIIFHLPLELGTSLYYEASYRSLPGHHHMVGHAHIKIELSGELSFVQIVKTDFLQHRAAGQRRPVTLAQQVSAKLGRLLRSIRREDLLQSYLSPVKWSDQLLKPDSPFIRRLGTLTKHQKVKHFRYDEFDCVCVGKMPYAQEAGFLDAFQDADNGEEDLLEAISMWSTRQVQSGHRERALCFVRKLGTGLDGLPSYCLISVERSNVASRLFTVSVEIFEGSCSASRRLGVLSSIREILGRQKDVRVLEMQMGPFLLGLRRPSSGDVDEQREGFLAAQYLHESWDLVYDKELLPLLMRRRAEIGGFWLLDSNESYALFARLHSKDGFIERKRDDPGDMVQYQVSILEDRVVVDLHMESEIGVFRERAQISSGNSCGQFETLVTNLKKRDQECGLALRARTHVLSVFEKENSKSSDTSLSHMSSTQHLLGYSSRVEHYFRGFDRAFVGANEMLVEEIKILLLADRFGPKVAILSIDPLVESQDCGPGLWFLINYDKDTIGILHVASEVSREIDDSYGCSLTSIRLTFHTLSISDLYTRREDFVGDDDSDQDTVEEYMCMTEFVEQLTNEYSFVYTRAAYKALLLSGCQDSSIHMDDLFRVMSPLTFYPVADVSIASGGENLVEILSTVIRKIPGETYYYFFKMDSSDLPLVGTESSSLASSDESVENDDEESGESMEGEALRQSNELETREGEDSTNASPPIFVRFLIDGENASMDDLASLSKSANLVALVTIYNEPVPGPACLPLSHRAPAGHIKRLLSAYVAEQTLERLRRHGRGILLRDLLLARKCLRRARDVLTSAVLLLFYSSTLDTMVSASVPAGSDGDIETGMRLLQQELLHLDGLKLSRMSDGSFILLGSQADADILPYWCFLDFGNGFVSIETHHPSGPESARRLLSSVHDIIMKQLHRVNQMLILRRLHKNRSATALMIEEDDKGPAQHRHVEEVDDEQRLIGLFACPLVFRKRFELFHRCATNPEQVARTVETSVLHIFSISNRRHTFVYRDESGSIFYMRLSTEGGGLEPDGVIDLEVYGIDQPTESVTKQLSRLISKKILSIAVDLLAGVLTKNPRYAWRAADVNFVEDYNRMWNEVGEGASVCDTKIRFYSLPVDVSDPSTILLYFRQNLCGSTYFHPFLANSTREDPEDVEVPRFVFYYNNVPSKLSPKLQGRSTLTSKGAEFARLAGQGLALIEVSLVDSDGHMHAVLEPSSVVSQCPADFTIKEDFITVKQEQKLDQPTSFWVDQGRLSNYFIKVKITDTAIKRNVLHDWVRLTLDQVTSGWCIERQLERQQCGLFKFASSPDNSDDSTVNKLIPGISALIKMWETAYMLPHPGAQKVSFDGVIRSSSVSSVALRLLDMTVEAIVRETRGSSKRDFLERVRVVRLSRGVVPDVVRLSWSSDGRRCLVHPHSSEGCNRDKKPLVDTHIDCPQYLIFFSSEEFTGKESSKALTFPKVFEEVNVGDDYKSEKWLSKIKSEMPNTFKRSFGFFLSVKRNSRYLLSYNWRADLFAGLALKLKDENAALLEATGRAGDRLQRHSLSFLSPSSTTKERHKFIAQPKKSSLKSPFDKPTQKNDVENKVILPRETSRRAVRPVSIRRPKLVGKSVDGSAAHAVAASRARASFKGSYGATPPPSGIKGNSSASTSNTRAPLGKVREGHLGDNARRSVTRERQKVSNVVKEFQSRRNVSVFSDRRHSLHQEATHSFIGSLWPIKSCSSLLPAGGDFIVNLANLESTNTAELLCFPQEMLETFTSAFANFLKDSVPGLRIVATSKQDQDEPQIIFLSGKARKMKALRCFPVLQLDMIRDQGNRRLLLRCTAWTISLPRQKIKAIDRIFQCRQILEMRASGPDKLATVIGSKMTNVDSKLVDFSCLCTFKVFGGNSMLTGLQPVKLALEICARYELEEQIRMLATEYKAFKYPLKLRSFGSIRLNHFESSALFEWLIEHAEERNLAVVGPKSLLLPTASDMIGIEVYSILLYTGEPSTLDMVIVCKAGNIDLHRFMFRSDSNVAVSVAKHLAIEAAGLAFRELTAASTSLRLQSLWKLASHEDPSRRKGGSAAIENELLELCEIELLQNSLTNLGKNVFEQVLSQYSGSKWSELCDVMSLEKAFSPSCSIANGQWLFYVPKHDIFVLIKARHKQEPAELSFVLKSCTPTEKSNKQAAAQMLVNYMLHFLWQSTAIES